MNMIRAVYYAKSIWFSRINWTNAWNWLFWLYSLGGGDLVEICWGNKRRIKENGQGRSLFIYHIFA